MVESGKEYVLQWEGHAARVTERFSGLFARQALVDVTLICQGQKLRVHKLVLASCSLYFEEMLEQDLGQEPVVLLRDLDFEVLKAMVEFMYCGETTISHCHLQALLDAAQVFMVKELECIVKSMMGTERIITEAASEPEESEGLISSSSDKRKGSKMRPSGERFDDAASLSSELEEDDRSPPCCKSEHILENGRNNSYDQVEHSLYESTELSTEMPPESCTEEEEEEELEEEEEEEEKEEEEEQESSENSETTVDSSDGETSKMCTSDDDDDEDEEASRDLVKADLKSLLSDKKSSHNRYDDYQDVPRVVGECSKVYTPKKRKYGDDYCLETGTSDEPTESSSLEDNILEEETPESQNNRDKCLKVYTHKRRKSLEERNNSRSSMSGVEEASSVKEPSSTSCIDLSDENPPVTLAATTLDMETSEYIWSLSSESIQYVVGCTINQASAVISGKETSFPENSNDSQRETDAPVNNKRVRHIKELFTVGDSRFDCAPPVLRRSVRINQLENDDSINNNAASKARDKHADKRKANKDIDCPVSDENNVTTTTIRQTLRKNGNNSRSLRSTSGKFTSGKSTRTKNYKDELKSRNNGRIKKNDNTECDVLVTNRLNTIASVDRALWGDMSDVLEHRGDPRTDLTADYSPSKEIPFALGLLPLRAALERMQATLDHQPRKTRSSVSAPLRQELNGFKRKDTESPNNTTKNKHVNDNDVLPNTVCHIQIRTSSQCTQNRKNTNEERIIAVGSTSENNRR